MTLLQILLFSAIIFAVITPVLLAIASNYVGQELILNSLNRFMVLIQGPFDFLRNITRNLINFIWNDMIKRALRSVGITREHWMQRTIGAVLFSVVFLVGVLVLVMNNVMTLEGLFGTEGVLKKYIPVDVELLMAIEIIAAIIASGAMVLDVVGITHLLKFLSSEFLSVPARWIIGILMTVIFTVGLYLLVVFGILRTDLLKGSNDDLKTSNNPENVQLMINDESLSTESDMMLQTENNNSPVITENTSENESTKILMCGMPIVSTVPGVFAALGLIPLGAMVAVLPLLLLQMVVGLFYQILSLLCRLIDLLYNFLDSVFNIIISAGRSVRDRGRRNEPVRIDTEKNESFETGRTEKTVDPAKDLEPKISTEEILKDISDDNVVINPDTTESYKPIY